MQRQDLAYACGDTPITLEGVDDTARPARDAWSAPVPSRRWAGGALGIAVRSRRQRCQLISPLVAAATLGWAAGAAAVEGESDVATDPARAAVFHTVEEGDTLYAIANHYGSSVELIVEANGIDDVLALAIGTRLRLPMLPDAHRSPGPLKRASARPERLLDDSELRLREARYESALELAESARAALNAQQAASNDPRRVRVQLVKATAYVALGRTDEALDSLERALLADPNLELDPAVTSPKLMAVFYVARGGEPPTR
jgi:tetratricopeptide (TPR) repeat protein